MSWSPDPHALRGRVAVVAGATRGAGRGIAAALGEAGATVVCTGRTTGSTRSEYNRPETIEDTAALVTQLGGTGIAVAADHLDAAQVKTLAEQIRKDHGHIDVLVNNIWGAELLKGGPAQWNTPMWAHDLDAGLRILRLAIDTHLVTSHHLLPLVIDRPGAGRRPEGRRRASSPRRRRNSPDFALSESPRYVGRAVAALAADPARARWNQRSVSSAELAHEYGFTDIDGSRPDIWRYFDDSRAGARPADLGDYR